jgi:hypothetical protein
MTVSDNTLADMDALISRALATSSGLNRILPTDTLATLKAQTPFAGAVVFMQGRATERDGGEGIFIWNAAPRRWPTMASGATGTRAASGAGYDLTRHGTKCMGRGQPDRPITPPL